jgi:hypothetical protein
MKRLLAIFVAMVSVSVLRAGERSDLEMAYDFSPYMQVGFSAQSKDEKKLRLTYSPRGATNFALFRIDKHDVFFGDPESGELRAKQASPAKRSGASGVFSLWAYEQIEVKQQVEIVDSPKGRRDVCLVTYHVANKGGAKASVGLRVLLDVFIVDNDGPVFFASDAPDKPIATLKEFKGDVPAYISAVRFADPASRDNLRVYLSIPKGPMQQAPNRLMITRLPKQAEEWECPLVDMAGDAAVAIYWSPQTLEPGGSRSYSYAYGLQPLGGK